MVDSGFLIFPVLNTVVGNQQRQYADVATEQVGESII